MKQYFVRFGTSALVKASSKEDAKEKARVNFKKLLTGEPVDETDEFIIRSEADMYVQEQ